MKAGISIISILSLALIAVCGWTVFTSSPVHAAENAFTTHYVKNGDATIAVREIGVGPAVVMVASASRAGTDFDDLAQRLAAQGFHALALDQRGTGLTKAPLTGITKQAFGDDIAAVIRERTTGKVVLLGHAGGAPDSRLAIRVVPERVSALISFGTGLGGSTLDPKLREEARKGLMGGIPRSREQRLKDLQLLFFAPGNDPSVWWGGWYPESAAPRAAAGQKVPRSVWWPGVKLPTLLVQAEQDTTAPMRPAADIKRELGGTDDIIVLSLPHANHAMLPEQPEAIAALVIAYLKGQREGLQDIINKNIRVPRTQ